MLPAEVLGIRYRGSVKSLVLIIYEVRGVGRRRIFQSPENPDRVKNVHSASQARL